MIKYSSEPYRYSCNQPYGLEISFSLFFELLFTIVKVYDWTNQTGILHQFSIWYLTIYWRRNLYILHVFFLFSFEQQTTLFYIICQILIFFYQSFFVGLSSLIQILINMWKLWYSGWGTVITPFFLIHVSYDQLAAVCYPNC